MRTAYNPLYMKHLYTFLLLLPIIFAITSCNNNPDTQVIRSFYSEYGAASDSLEDTSPVIQKYGSDMLKLQLDSVADPDVLDYNPFFNNQDGTGLNADSLTIEQVEENVYRVFGSTVSDTVILRMNKFHKIDRILSI